jgi:hypothetical protein
MLRVSFSPRSSESLMASSDLAARVRVSGVSVARVVIGIAESDQVDEDMVFLFRVARRILGNVCLDQKAEFARKLSAASVSSQWGRIRVEFWVEHMAIEKYSL